MIIKKKKLFLCRLRGVHVSSIVNEAVRAILNFFVFFLRQNFSHTKIFMHFMLFLCVKFSRKKKKKFKIALIASFTILLYNNHINNQAFQQNIFVYLTNPFLISDKNIFIFVENIWMHFYRIISIKVIDLAFL